MPGINEPISASNPLRLLPYKVPFSVRIMDLLTRYFFVMLLGGLMICSSMVLAVLFPNASGVGPYASLEWKLVFLGVFIYLIALFFAVRKPDTTFSSADKWILKNVKCPECGGVIARSDVRRTSPAFDVICSQCNKKFSIVSFPGYGGRYGHGLHSFQLAYGDEEHVGRAHFESFLGIVTFAVFLFGIEFILMMLVILVVILARSNAPQTVNMSAEEKEINIPGTLRVLTVYENGSPIAWVDVTLYNLSGENKTFVKTLTSDSDGFVNFGNMTGRVGLVGNKPGYIQTHGEFDVDYSQYVGTSSRVLVVMEKA